MKNNKLTAQDLMIGDWVMSKVRLTDPELEYIKIKDGKTIDEFCRMFKPIPLTAEILEKNGFTCDANGMNDSDEPVVSVEYGEFQRNTDDGLKMLADGKAIKYVHELQHALRLCGIEKEITL